MTRYGVKQDGRTAYERLRGRSYKGEVAEFGEVVHKISNQNLRKLEDRWSCGFGSESAPATTSTLLQRAGPYGPPTGGKDAV